MRCPKCKHTVTRVLDSRDTNDNKETRRRRVCESCNHRFTTFERVETTNLIVIKRDKSRETYSREKLKGGIWKSCEKRPVTKDQIDSLVASLEEKWSATGKEIESTKIGEAVMDALKQLDEVAYIRFASVYRRFKDLESFKEELTNLLE